MSRSSSGAVAGLTAAAIAVVGFLAYQASADVPDNLGKAPAASSGPSPTGSAKPSAKPRPDALPEESGSGTRVVYALGKDRVWLVDAKDKVERTYKVSPSTVDPEPGTYAVTSRSGSITGSDGVPIEHVVRFATRDGVVIGFSAAVNGSVPELDPTQRTGGVRETREDGKAMWVFATVGTKVVVLP